MPNTVIEKEDGLIDLCGHTILKKFIVGIGPLTERDAGIGVYTMSYDVHLRGHTIRIVSEPFKDTSQKLLIVASYEEAKNNIIEYIKTYA